MVVFEWVLELEHLTSGADATGPGTTLWKPWHYLNRPPWKFTVFCVKTLAQEVIVARVPEAS